jgi:tRNA-specific 2-thiouridylase
MNSLGFNKEPKDTRIVVAMSGGVDSSVTAALLQEQGYDVVGVTLQLYDHGIAVGRKGACCAGQDIYDAHQVAEKIGIPHYVLDYESKFSQSVMDDFADSYMRGETPIPCVRCNQRVKFRDMLAMARDLGAEALATGHYVQRIMGDHGAELHRAIDDGKDQSYFLFTTTQQQLDFLRFPLGSMTKSETRELAERFNLPVANKPDSQDICFVPNGDYTSIVQKLRPGAIDPGDIVDASGQVLGRHEGIIHFTVGQRRGLNIDARDGENNQPLYVVRIDAERRHVVVGPKAALARTEIRLRDMNWLGNNATPATSDIMVKLRSAQTPVAASIERNEGDATLSLYEPAFGVAPGQAGVIYQGSRVLGGGWITGIAQS